MAGILIRREKRGPVECTRDTEDRRRMTAAATTEGLELLEGATSPLQDRFRAAVQTVSSNADPRG